jgi:multidrug efflux pump
MSLSAPFIHRPVATTLLSASILLLGALAFSFLPVSPLPQVDFPAISVNASLPGASPEIMASTVATPLERALGTIAGVNEISSNSSQGSTQIFIQFDLGKDINGAAREVQAAINASRSLLPSALPGMPTYRKINPSQAPIMILALTSDTARPSVLYDLASTVLAQKIAQVTGVGEVRVGGSSLPAVRVELQPNALIHYGIALDEVRRAIDGANKLRPKGIVEDDARRWQVAASDQLARAKDYEPLVVTYRDNAPVRLSDVARVYDGVEDRFNSGFFNRKPAVLLLVSRQTDANIIATVDAVRAQLPALRAFLPGDVHLDIASDRSPGIRATLHEAERTLLIAVGLVIVVVWLFLANVRASLIPVAAVPVSLVGSFAVMYLCGFSLNNLSLMALIVATGLVVDDAIVVLENIARHREAGMPAAEAALKGAEEVGATLLSMNLSLVAVFVSMLFMGGIVERLFREFSITLVTAILISLVVSLTLTPMLCAKWLGGRAARRLEAQEPGPGAQEQSAQGQGAQGQDHYGVEAEARPRSLNERVFARLLAGYDRTLRWSLRHAPTVGALLLVVIGLNVALYTISPKTFLPNQDTGQLGGFIRGDDGMSFSIMQPKIEAYRKALLEDPAVESVAGFIGGGRGINNAQTFVRLKPLAERGESAEKVVDRIRRTVPRQPGSRLWIGIEQDIRIGGGGGFDAGYRYRLLGDDSAQLRAWGQKVSDALRTLPELTGFDDELVSSQQIELQIDRSAARQLGVEMTTVTQALNNAFGQRQVSTIYNALNQYRVVMEVAPELAQGPEALDRMFVISSSAQRVPLSAFSRYVHVSADDRVNHYQQFASQTISFDLVPGVPFEQAKASIERAISRLAMPVAIQGRLQGNAELLQRMQGNQPLAILGTLLVVYIVLGVLYESTIHPLTILSTLPSAGVGALLALRLLRTEFSLIALLGVFLLIGVVMKNAILMIDVALQIEREHHVPPHEAIRRACLLRLRPILMTTMAAILGALPLMLGMGEGNELRRPLGIAIVGGLVVSQVLTLYTTPVVYLYLERLRTWGLRRRAGRVAVEAATTT